MWLMTQYGFFSVVREGDDENRYVVRARVLNDLENLRRLANLEGEVVMGGGTDYPYRIFISGEELEDLMNALAQTVDYNNFKNRVHELPDQKHKSRLYGQVWSLLRDLDEPAEADVARGDYGMRAWPEDPDEIEAMFNEVLECGKTGEHQHAIELLDTIIERAPQTPVAHWLKGVHLGSLGRHEEAVWALKAGLDMEPNDPHALFNMALACTRTGRHEGARFSLQRALETDPDFSDAMLLMGFVFAHEHDIETPETMDEWLESHEPGQLDLDDAQTYFLITLAHLALEDRAGAQRQWEELRDLDEELAAQVEPWIFEEIITLGESTPPDEWQSENDDLRAALERAARWANLGETVPAEATEMVYRAVMDGWLLVPLNEEPDERATGISLALRAGPLEGLNGEIGLIAFTDEDAASAFFNGMPEHNVVLRGPDLYRALAQMAGHWTDSGHAPVALVINPAGPHPYALSLPSLVFLATGGVPLDQEHAVIGEGTQVDIRLPEEQPDEKLLLALRQAVEASAPQTGAREVWWFQVRFGDNEPHFGLGVAPGETEIVDAVGRSVNEAWGDHAASLAVYDVLGMDGDMGVRIRNSGELLWIAEE